MHGTDGHDIVAPLAAGEPDPDAMAQEVPDPSALDRHLPGGVAPDIAAAGANGIGVLALGLAAWIRRRRMRRRFAEMD